MERRKKKLSWKLSALFGMGNFSKIRHSPLKLSLSSNATVNEQTRVEERAVVGRWLRQRVSHVLCCSTKELFHSRPVRLMFRSKTHSTVCVCCGQHVSVNCSHVEIKVLPFPVQRTYSFWLFFFLWCMHSVFILISSHVICPLLH